VGFLTSVHCRSEVELAALQHKEIIGYSDISISVFCFCLDHYHLYTQSRDTLLSTICLTCTLVWWVSVLPLLLEY